MSVVADTLQSNKELVRQLVERGFNQGDLDVVDDIVDPGVVTHNPLILDAPTGPESVRGGIAMIRRSFPDFHAEILDLIAEDDRVAVFLQLRGTNEGDYRRGAATRREGSFRAFFIWRVANGRLVENWGVADRFALLQQLGIIPSDDDLAARTPSPGAPG